jgi:hypothetical protein
VHGRTERRECVDMVEQRAVDGAATQGAVHGSI